MQQVLLFALTLAFLRCYCHSQEFDDTEVCDFVVIGSGTAGLTVGGLLADIPYWRVCMLERGPSENERKMYGWGTNSYKFTSAHDPVWLTEPTLQTIVNGYNQNKDGRNIYIPRYRGRGGTSRVYGAIVRRASPDVLDMWPRGWKHEELSHYYRKSEDHYCHYDSEAATGISEEECNKWHGKGGGMQVNTQLKEAFQKFPREMAYICNQTTRPWNGFAADYNGPEEGRISCSMFQQFKLRTEERDNRASKTGRGSSFTVITRRINKPELYTQMTVTKILFDGNGVATGVLCHHGQEGQVVKFLARKEVILGGGAFDTPHLLQVSGVGPRDLLKKIKVGVVADNPHVGQHLWDHISVPYVLKLSPESDDLCCSVKPGGTPYVNIDGQIRKTSYLDSINGPFSWILHYRSNNTRGPKVMSDIQLYVMGNSKLFDETGSLCTSDAGLELNEYEFDGEHEYDDKEENLEGTIRIINQWPEYRGTVTASTSSILDKPSVDYGWSYTVDGVQTPEFQEGAKLMRDQIRLLRDMFFGNDVHENLKKLVVDEVAPGKDLDTDEELDAWFRGMYVSALHPACTCKMPECADEYLQVRGVSKLRVCDTSAFATQTDGNPAATLYAMGEKLADMLKYQYVKYVKVAVRKDLFVPVEDGQDYERLVDVSTIKAGTQCIDVSFTSQWISTGKDTSAVLYEWSLTCNGEFDDKEVANFVAKATLDSDTKDDCSSEGIPLFTTENVADGDQESKPLHYESSYIYIVWCQAYKSATPDELWTKVGTWKGPKIPGTTNCFKLNCDPEICSKLVKFDDSAREFVYTDGDSMNTTDYTAIKKVASRHYDKSSVYFRSASMKSYPGADWKFAAEYFLEDVYASSGRRLSRQYPPLNSQPGWWSETSDGLLYYEANGMRTSTKLASFDLDGTLIDTKSGDTFPQDENDWVFKYDGVVAKLQANHKNKINNVIMSNQNGIESGAQSKTEWMDKIEQIVSQVDIPMYAMASIRDNKYRKPKTGMWDYYTCKLNQFQMVDKASAVYVGDAAGRPSDFSDSDKQFADNVGVQFQTEEAYFQGKVEL
ncbi:LOW QUALITY PROTEIN: uncharacterized protein [Amphiura filiformis]|uniref:LOW QUALITY PROTEIN: uncharacterized protein n=1 Tax=Amphiura filiformis TaxID=82378 RepID=UPI003B21F064